MKFPWLTPHAADPSLDGVSFPGISCPGRFYVQQGGPKGETSIQKYRKIIDFGTHFELILGPWADLGPPWDLKG